MQTHCRTLEYCLTWYLLYLSDSLLRGTLDCYYKDKLSGLSHYYLGLIKESFLCLLFVPLDNICFIFLRDFLCGPKQPIFIAMYSRI